MNFKKRLDRLDAIRPPSPCVPRIFYSVVEPSENGPREVGVFAKIRSEGEDLMVWRGEHEKQESFESRVTTLNGFTQPF